MSILSTLNKLTGKSDKNVLAALNSLTGKTADDIEEAVGNLSVGGGKTMGEVILLPASVLPESTVTWDQLDAIPNSAAVRYSYLNEQAQFAEFVPSDKYQETIGGTVLLGYLPAGAVCEKTPGTYQVSIAFNEFGIMYGDIAQNDSTPYVVHLSEFNLAIIPATNSYIVLYVKQEQGGPA